MAISNFRFVAPLPEWADHRTNIRIFQGTFVLAHPKHKPVMLDAKKKEWVPLNAGEENEKI